ncbi:MAG: thioredoxin family protein [Planctomycetaceae bacterium]
MAPAIFSYRTYYFSILTTFLALGLPLSAMAGKFNTVLSPGDSAPAFAGLEGVDGKKYALEDFSKAEVIVLAFTCNSCPYAVDLEDRLIALSKEFEANPDKCVLVAIGSNTIPADALEAMTQKAKEKKFPFVYVHDASQKVAKEYGATRTPEVFVFNKERKLVYQGMFDDSPDGKKVTIPYVKQAVTDTLAGKSPTVQETAPVGCLIRFAKTRGKSK